MALSVIDVSAVGTFIKDNAMLEHGDAVSLDYWTRYSENTLSPYSLYKMAMCHNAVIDWESTGYIYAQIPPCNPSNTIRGYLTRGSFIEITSAYAVFKWGPTDGRSGTIKFYGGTDIDNMGTIGTFLTTTPGGSGTFFLGTFTTNAYYFERDKLYAKPYFYAFKGIEDAARTCQFTSVGIWYRKYPLSTPALYTASGTFLFNDATGTSGTYYGTTLINTQSGGAFFQIQNQSRIGSLDGTKFLELTANAGGGFSYIYPPFDYICREFMDIYFNVSNPYLLYKIAFTGNTASCSLSVGFGKDVSFSNNNGIYTITASSTGQTGTLDFSSGDYKVLDLYITSPDGGYTVDYRFAYGLSINLLTIQSQPSPAWPGNPWPFFRFSHTDTIGTSCIGISSMTGSWTI